MPCSIYVVFPEDIEAAQGGHLISIQIKIVWSPASPEVEGAVALRVRREEGGNRNGFV